ncbi:F0F1 ATP synthase subunit B [Candidatus Parcubacteria bacterium]|nr:F0F1 ATP synthase subunit B [Candidatus Parcubacteria bacterium]
MASPSPTTELAHEAAQTVTATGGLGMLGINLKIFIAQLFNFVLVLLVLWKWVYRPLVKLLDARTARIEKSMKQADEIEKRMAGLEEEQARVIAQAKSEAAVMLEQARESAEQRKKELLEGAKGEVQKVIAQGKEQLKAEKQNMVREAKTELVELAVEAARKILQESVNEKKSKQLAEEAIETLSSKASVSSRT